MFASVVAIGEEPAAPFSPARLVTESALDPFLATLLIVSAGAYLWGVRRLRARGDAWSGWRTASFLGGLGAMAAATLSGLGAYDETLFSAHMAQHMILSMIAPIFLALGAPVTLALRTLPLRPRRVVLSVLHSRVARLVTFPLVGWMLYVFSPFVLYFSGWYPASLDSVALHELLHLHFILVGCVFFWPLIGLDPVPGKVAYPMRFLLLFAALPFHAILGVTIMSGDTLIAAEHYQSLDLSWVDPLADQKLGGGLLWASGDLIGLLMLGALFTQWMHASEREAEREDRRLDRLEALAARRAGGGAERTAYPGPAESGAPSGDGAIVAGNPPDRDSPG